MVCSVLDVRGADNIDCLADDSQLVIDACTKSGYLLQPYGVRVVEIDSQERPRVPLILGDLIVQEVRHLFAGEVLCVVLDATFVQFIAVEGLLWVAPGIPPPAFVSVLK